MNNIFSKKLLLGRILTLAVVLGLAGVCILIFENWHFHLVGTSPSLEAVTIITPTLNFNYNHTLSSDGISVTSKDPIVASFRVSGKSLFVNLNSSVLAVSKTYTVVIGDLHDTKNNKLMPSTYSFKIVSVSFNDLAKSQQAVILSQQDNASYTRSSINYSGFDTLTTNGLSTYQLEDVKQAFFLYSNSIKQATHEVTVLTNSLVLGPYDSNSPNPVSSLVFKVRIDNIELSAKLVYSGLSSAELYLYNPTNQAQLFDSSLLTFSNI